MGESMWAILAIVGVLVAAALIAGVYFERRKTDRMGTRPQGPQVNAVHGSKHESKASRKLDTRRD
ncbi:hypothetical protein [Qipengyuania sp.]|uniref:hypothetical protein n=1 Tax=Qipengyuania sp. TaxID=2004515 RepID=UPI0035C7B846